MDRKIFFAEFCRYIFYKNQVIIGNILEDGKWIKMPKDIFEYLKWHIDNHSTVRQILDETESEEEYRFYDNLLRNLFLIRTLQFEEDTLDYKMESLSLDLTSKCNLRCKHCSTAFGEIPNVDLPVEDMTRIIQWAENKNIDKLTLTGGEIFVLPDIMERLKKVRKIFSGKIDIITNATLIDQSKMPELIKCVDAISISLDGYDKQSVDQIRGKGVYEKVMACITQLKALGFSKISLSMILTQENHKNREKFIHLCQELDVKPMPRVLNPRGRAKKNYQELRIVDDKAVYTDEELKEIRSNLTMKSTCGAGNTTIAIYSNREVHPCAAMDEASECVGNIEDLLNDKIKLESLLSDCIVDYIEPCRECPVRYFCSDTCKAMNNTIFSNPQFREERCKRLKDLYIDLLWNE